MKYHRVFSVWLTAIMLCTTSFAQTYQGRILGTATDAGGAVVKGVKVTITNTGTGVSRMLETNESGDYAAPNLPPGAYKITGEAAGFKRVEISSIQLEVAKDIRIDLEMVPGAVSESITVTGDAPIIETTNNTLGGTFSNQAINDLPLNGRDFQNLVVLRPGIQRSTGGGFLSISSNGNRPENNNFIVDGTDNNDPYYGTTVINAEGVQGTPGTILPDRRDPGVQRAGEPSRRVRLEAGSHHQPRAEVRHERPSRDALLLPPQQRARRAQLLQHGARPQEGPAPAPVRGQLRRPDQARQDLLLRLVRRRARVREQLEPRLHARCGASGRRP